MRILIASTAFPDGPDLLRQRLPEDEIVVDAATAQGTFDVIVPLMTRIDGDVMDRFRPRLIQQFGVGLEGVDRAAAAQRDIPVTNVPGEGTGNADAVGEIAILHLLALSRRYHEGRPVLERGSWGEPAGVALSDRTIVVLGLGAVGQAVARRLTGFGARLLGVGTRRGVDPATYGLDAYLPVDRLVEAVDGVHALIVCCILNDATRGIVGPAVLGAMARGGYVVNVARGAVIDRAALLAALRSGQIGGAGLDVFWQEPLDPGDPLLAENVTVTPHVGGVTEQSYGIMADRVVANIERLRRGEPIPSV